MKATDNSTDERTLQTVLGELDTNQDTIRILADMGQDLCSQWGTHDGAAQNGRMVEQLFVIFGTQQEQLKKYDELIRESSNLIREA